MKVDESKAGNVTGMVALEGTAPRNEPIKMNADPVCAQEAKGPQAQETYVVGSDGKSLGNVFVYVKDGLGNYVFDIPSEPAKIDQKECRYHPHVFGMRTGQTLKITNSDPTLHNIHATPKDNTEFNVGQPVKGMTTDHTFPNKEVMVPFKCDVHGWMNAYVGVLDHPYFAVTNDSGKFELNKLPAGTYTVEAWHERLGAQSQSVTVGANETKEITFTFKVAAGN
jgi:plastocyanin